MRSPVTQKLSTKQLIYILSENGVASVYKFSMYDSRIGIIIINDYMDPKITKLV